MSDKKDELDIDLSNLSPEQNNTSETQEPVVTTAPDQQTKSTPRKSARNIWINGIPIEDIDSEQLADWVFALVYVDISLKDLTTVTKKVKTVDKVIHLNKTLTQLNIAHTNKNTQIYEN